METPTFFSRDISWLTFNERVMMEAAKEDVPLMERIRFLSIFSSNLDEFYRVRMPALLAIQKLKKFKADSHVYTEAVTLINQQQQRFGEILNTQIIPLLEKEGYTFLNKKPLPEALLPAVKEYFFTQVAGLLQPVNMDTVSDFFPKNNQLYQAAIIQYNDSEEQLYLINIPVEVLPRFYVVPTPETKYIIYLEDIIKQNLRYLFKTASVKGVYNIKITRDADLGLEDEYEEDMAAKIEKQLAKRDLGFATRFLYQPGMPLRHLENIIDKFALHKASVVEGGHHHNLKDLFGLPVDGKHLNYPAWPVQPAFTIKKEQDYLFDTIAEKDRIVHAPYQSYDMILRFFNEAAMDESVQEIYTTLYRMASSSKIAQALISAAKNGKKVSVLVELKARFDEANNIHWAKKMKEAGVRIIYSDSGLKVHAKVALVKRKHDRIPYLGMMATGNLNEITARFYTDHILLTAHQPMLEELQMLFGFLAKRKKPEKTDLIPFKHLLVAQFNLQTKFIELIDREIANAAKGLPASIIIKINNLEEETLIEKLYEASNAGVQIRMAVRSICRLVPGVKGQSENITIKRIVDRYLEHGRVFIFHNNGQEEVFMGSADWMNRNVYRRIEVCFPIYDAAIREQLKTIIGLQLNDNVQAVWIDDKLSNTPVKDDKEKIRSQEAIYQYVRKLNA